MPKVSVIIPVYNVEKYLGECLDSVLGQTMKEIEVLCVDDGSTDDSAKVLADYAAKDARVKVISYAESLGSVESLITFPLMQTHGAMAPELRKSSQEEWS